MGRVRALQALRRDRADRVTIGSVRLTGAETQAGGKLVVECEHIAKSFPPSNDQDSSYVVLKDFSTRVLRGDRVGIVGPNGAGKTTLLKILLGEIEPDKGKIRHGTNLMPAIFDQRREGLIAGRSVRETLVGGKGDTVFVQDKPRHVMSYLRDFLFEDRQAQQDVDRLSGGERNRLLLAKVLAQQSNVLVLDEPTNDLDMDTLDLLEEVLADYDGTLFLVSHDRDFLDRLVTSTIAVEGSGDVAEYVGGYTDYVRQRPVREKPRQAAAAVAPKPPPPAKPKPARLGFREQHDLERLPEMIDRLTAEKRRLEATLADAGLYARDAGAFTKATGRLGEVQHELEAAEERWLDLELKRADLEG
jgi:ATP-binding cassette subfamily F protein uup